MYNPVSNIEGDKLMDVTIYFKNVDKEQIIEEFKKALDKEIDWKIKDFSISADVEMYEGKAQEIFEKLLDRFPDIDFYGSYSISVREEDRSAQWWETYTIKSAVKDGRKVIKTSCSTGWN